ncbi:fibronectin type III domain-containing protein 10 [Leuresthes tenuis]|uniref:fibronectin type III domain-containing protein 10 n=1 Tax=Leuresthes tenuis TaxID=355514 RepID=UPI003B50BF25
MTNQHRPSLLALSALLLCTLIQQTAGSHRSGSASSPSTSSSEVRGRNNEGTVPNWLGQIHSSVQRNHSHDSRPSAKLKDKTGHVKSSSVNTSRSSNTAVTSERSGMALSQRPDEGVSPICAYRVIEGGIWGQLCFRHTLFGYKCYEGDCRTSVSLGNLVANILINGSVLLQWTHEGESIETGRDMETAETAAGERSSGDPRTNSTQETSRSNIVFGERRQRRGGYELSCWWNGSYTQFECASVHLGSGCRDFLLAELHENIPYRICLRPLVHSDPDKRADQRDCVEFTLPPSGMQDIVIAMTTVGGAICVMLVIICLLVAYITENIMSPTTPHTYSYRTHSRH